MDINCDMGESYGRFKVGNDLEILPYIDSCNLACGFHGGDPATIYKTIIAALNLGKNIGAHPAYPDLSGFGRRSMTLTDDQLRANLLYQISASKGMVESLGGKLHHVKLHGALYHDIAKSEIGSTILCQVINSIQGNLILLVPPHSVLSIIAKDYGIRIWKEGFADRRYQENGRLVSRNDPEALITDPGEAALQTIMIKNDKCVKAVTGEIISLEADTVCLHGDTKNALEIVQEIRKSLR